MTAIPNTIRRGAIYWYRRSRCLPSGKSFRPTVSLRTACPQAARQRAALLTAKFEDLFMRLFGNPGRRLALDSAAIKRIFEKEFELALDAIEEEREQANMPGYEFRDFGTYLDVHEEVYRYLAETSSSHGQSIGRHWQSGLPVSILTPQNWPWRCSPGLPRSGTRASMRPQPRSRRKSSAQTSSTWITRCACGSKPGPRQSRSIASGSPIRSVGWRACALSLLRGNGRRRHPRRYLRGIRSRANSRT